MGYFVFGAIGFGVVFGTLCVLEVAEELAWLSFGSVKGGVSMLSLICAITGVAAWEAFSAGAALGAAAYAVGKGVKSVQKRK